jgi:DNA repair exonuclease SbcCD ATPase subunit
MCSAVAQQFQRLSTALLEGISSKMSILGGLESLINGLIEKQNTADAKIKELQTELHANRVSKQEFNLLSQRVEQLSNEILTKQSIIETKQHNLSASITQIADLQSNLAKNNEILSSTINRNEFSLYKTEVNNSMESLRNQLGAEKVSVQQFDRLEDVCSKFQGELYSLQSLCSNKLDKSELPLLEVSLEKLKNLLSFQNSTNKKLIELDAQLLGLNNKLQTKESKENIVLRMQNIGEELKKKADISYIEGSVNLAINSMQTTLKQLFSGVETINKQLVPLNQTQSQQAESHHTLISLQEKLNSLENSANNLEIAVNNKADVRTVEELLKYYNNSINSTEIKASQQKILADYKLQSAYLAEFRTQLSSFEQREVEYREKLAIALRFIDWFTEVKLKHI